MIIKRIRRSAKRQRRSLQEIGRIVNVLSTYVLNASTDKLLAADGENALASYVLDTQILEGHATAPGEKVDLHGVRRLLGNQLSQQQRQMLAANLLAPRAMDSIEHYILSWQSGELPVPAQVEEAVDIFAQEMGFENCQIIWATHSNTPNYHLHLVVNRVDLARQKVVTPAGGWDIDRLHQVSSLIEDAQGWASEPNSIYTARGGEVRERSTGKVMRRANGSRQGCDIRKKASAEKGRSPEYPAVADALKAAQTWQELHNRLSKLHATYRQKGSGAVITIGEVQMKASDLGREFSYGEMTKRLGHFTPDLFCERDAYEDYLAGLRAERARVREALNEALAQLRARRLAMKKKARAEKESHATLIDEARRLRCLDLAEAQIKKAFDRARATISQNQLRREAWHKANCPDPYQVELPVLVFAHNYARDEEIAAAHGLNRQEYDHAVEYRRDDGTLAISDAGIVLVVDPSDRNAIAASLALAHRRGDFIPVFGPPSFQQVCREVAKAKGYALVLATGEALHDPAVVDEKVASSKSVNESTSKTGTQSKKELSSSEPKNSEKTPPQKSAPRRTPNHFSRFPQPSRDDENDELSDAVRLAAMKGRRNGSSL
ncbi:relaxase/mobilization nuclease domain-containing protein [Qipengyuania flava]|nr:relaxase/mobilization nuclease domain-containing protein [Qipengyuania flava]